MKKIKKILVAVLCMIVAGTCIGVLAGCDFGGDTKEINISGSTSMKGVMTALADAYMQKNQDVEILIQDSGSGQGIKDATNGAVDIGMSSRALTSEEKEALNENIICKDGIVMIVNKDVELDNVTSDEVFNLYALGTPVGPIKNPINREGSSGTRDGFNTLITNSEGENLKSVEQLKGEEATSTGAVISTIAGSMNSLGYISLASLSSSSEIKSVKLDGVEGTVETIKSGEYKLQRPFVLATNKKGISEDAQKFMDFIASEEGQKIIEAEGLILL